MKYENQFLEYFSKLQLFTTGDAKRYLSRLGASEGYSRLLLHNLVKARKLERLSKGVYTFSRNEAVSGFAFRPFYYGAEYAMTIRKIWTQQSIPTIFTKSKANPGIRTVAGIKVLIRRIAPSAFFGFEFLKYSGIFVPVAVPEKIILDLLYFRIRVDEETFSNLMDLVDVETLVSYASRLGSFYVRRIENIIREQRKSP